MKAVVVLPWLDRDLMYATAKSMALDPRWEPLLVDNSETNLGVASAWNLGAWAMIEREADWLILLSTSVRFNLGGVDFLDGLEIHKGVDMVGGLDCGWHLHAISQNTMKRVGLFDEQFNPAYYEDNDWLYRYRLDCGNKPISHRWVPVDHLSLGDAHSMRFNHVTIDIGAQRSKYVTKWGGDPDHETYVTPYGK